MREVKLDKLTFEIRDDGTARVTECEKDATEVVVPVRVEGAVVTEIKDHAFEYCKKLRKIELPEPDEEVRFDDPDFREIGDNAFMDCTSLEEIYLPYTVSAVYHGAFYGCTALKKVVIGNSHRPPYFAPYAFSSCTSLVEIPCLRHASEGMFSCCESLTFLPITNECKEIDEDCFEHCDSLTEITIPKSVKRIGPLAFRGCKNLRSVTFEDPTGWSTSIVYFPDREPIQLDLSDPEKNARRLSGMDFDDGVRGWFKK